MDNQDGLLEVLSGRQKAFKHDPVLRNILERIEVLVRAFSGPCSVREPLVLIIATPIGGLVQRVKFQDPGYDILPPAPTDDGADIRGLFEGTGFRCETRYRVKKPPKSSKKVVQPPDDPSRNSPPERIFFLYPGA